MNKDDKIVKKDDETAFLKRLEEFMLQHSIV